mgnify:CR=1 FL=1
MRKTLKKFKDRGIPLSIEEEKITAKKLIDDKEKLDGIESETIVEDDKLDKVTSKIVEGLEKMGMGDEQEQAGRSRNGRHRRPR